LIAKASYASRDGQRLVWANSAASALTGGIAVLALDDFVAAIRELALARRVTGMVVVPFFLSIESKYLSQFVVANSCKKFGW